MKVMTWLRQAEAMLMTLAYPRQALCLSCGGLSQDMGLCTACQADMDAAWLSGDLCPLCGHELTASPCSFCQGDAPGRMCSAWAHQGAARRLIHRLKYGCTADAATVLARGMADAARRLSLPQNTVITWVAMPAKRRKRRGIDHSRVLAQALAREMNLPCRPLLARRSIGHTQQGLGRRARLRNLQDAYVCTERISCPVLLVDDVMTTSATARVCLAALRAAGAQEAAAVTATQAR